MTARPFVPAFLFEPGAHALCAEVDPEAFFPEQGQSNATAKAVCAKCDLRDPCLAYALQNDDAGVWGGAGENERRRIRGRRSVPREPKPITHGTASGYAIHIRRSEQPCEACREAQRRRLQDQRKRGVA